MRPANPSGGPDPERLHPGSPDWWEHQPSSDRSEGRRTDITVHSIAHAALRLIDADGLDALSMRKLALELGTGTTTLYRYVDGKEAVLAHVLDAVLTEAPHWAFAGPPVDVSGWRTVVATMMRSFRDTLRAHPHVVPLFVGGDPVGPSALAGRQVLLDLLAEAGFPISETPLVMATLTNYVIGFSLIALPVDGGKERKPERLHRYYENQPPELFPRLVELAGPLSDPVSEVSFDFGLEVVLDGLSARLAALDSGRT